LIARLSDDFCYLGNGWCVEQCLQRHVEVECLAASQVISRVSQTFNLDVPLKALLDAPTIAQMAEVIAQAGDQIARTELARLLSEIEAMPEDEARKQVREKNLAGKT
jgi:hypothetical protein